MFKYSRKARAQTMANGRTPPTGIEEMKVFCKQGTWTVA
jgi:hypothetical protein